MKIRKRIFLYFGGIIISLILIAFVLKFKNIYFSSGEKDVRFRILCMGDSITAGRYPDNLSKYFFSKDMKDIHVKNLGRDGNTSGEYLAYLKNQVIWEKKFDFVLLQLGTNDVRIDKDHTNTDQFKKNIEKIVKLIRIREPHVEIFLATVPSILKEIPDFFSVQSRERVTQEINPVIRELAQSLECELVDVYSLFDKHLEWINEDGIHPNNEGYKQLATQWGKVLIPFIKERSCRILYTLPPGFSEQVVFQSDIDGDTDLYLLSKAGIDKLTENDFPDEYPVFSPDGKRILYMAKPGKYWQLYVMTQETEKIELLFQEEGNFSHPCWAPDGKAIAFDTDLWGQTELAKFDLEKKIITRLTDTSGRNALPDWSPDGRTIAFTGNRQIGWHVFSLDLTTKRIRKLTGEGNCRPHWSPDGTWIAYVSIKKEYSDIYLMKPDGSEIHSLTLDPFWWDYYPNWSRDGKRLYFAKSEEHRGRSWNLYVMNLDGDQLIQITFGNSLDRHPDVY